MTLPPLASSRREDTRIPAGSETHEFWPNGHNSCGCTQATGIETVVVRPRGDGDGEHTVQPLTVEMLDGTATQNLFGASIELFGAVATFDSDAIRAIIEHADLEALVITRAGEFKCNLDDTRLKRGYNPAEDR